MAIEAEWVRVVVGRWKAGSVGVWACGARGVAVVFVSRP
jgi:hypothetical protein